MQCIALYTLAKAYGFFFCWCSLLLFVLYDSHLLNELYLWSTVNDGESFIQIAILSEKQQLGIHSLIVFQLILPIQTIIGLQLFSNLRLRLCVSLLHVISYFIRNLFNHFKFIYLITSNFQRKGLYFRLVFLSINLGNSFKNYHYATERLQVKMEWQGHLTISNKDSFTSSPIGWQKEWRENTPVLRQDKMST